MNEDLRAVLDRTDPPGMCCPAADALRAVLDYAEDEYANRFGIHRVIAEHLGVTGD